MSQQIPIGCREVHRGVTFGFYARNGVFSSQWALDQVQKMVDLNINWVVLIATVMQDTPYSDTQYRDFEVTPGDHELMTIIDALHQAGIRVHLRPMLETQNGQGRLQVQYFGDGMGTRIPGRGSDHWARWFNSMRKRSVYYARIAQQTGCEMYGLDSELDRFVDQNENWKSVVKAVREVYDGPVSSCHTTHTGVVDFDKHLANKDHWWYDLDMLELSCYAKGPQHLNASVQEIVDQLKPTVERFRNMAKTFGKPVMLGEVGCTSSTGGAMHPSGWQGDGKYDPQEQANYLTAVLESFWNEPWWYGMYWWKWDEQNKREQFLNDPAGDKGFIVDGKPAAQIMKQWFARTDRP